MANAESEPEGPSGGPETVPEGLPSTWVVERDVLVLIGGGASEAARAMGVPAGSRLVVVLPGRPGKADDALSAGPGEAPADVPEGARVVRGEGELLAALLGMGPPIAHHVVVRPTADPWADAERRSEVARWIRRAIHSWQIQVRTVQHAGPTWLLQSLNNLTSIARHPSVAALTDAFAGKPCVIASPGPSLAKNVHLLAELEGRALLLSGTHGLSILERAGVTPDLVLAADAGDLERHVVGCDLSRIGALAVSANCREVCFGFGVRHVFTFSGNGPADSWIYALVDEKASLPSGGSVACSALSLAHAMGCDPIAFVGQDLAFTGDRFYADGSLDGAAEVRRNADGSFFLRLPGDHAGPGGRLADGGKRFTADQRMVEVPGYLGGTVPTSESFYAFLIWFEGVAQLLRGTVRLWNCTEGGARIEGMEQLPLAAAVEAWAAEAVEPAEVFAKASASANLERRRVRFLDFARSASRDLERCASLAARCYELSLTAEHDVKTMNALGRGEAELSRSLRPLRFLALFAQAEIDAARAETRNAVDLAGNLRAARRLFRVIQEASAHLAEPLARARRELAHPFADAR